MKVELRDYYLENKEARELAHDLPWIAILSNAPNVPGAAIKRARHLKFKDLKSRHVKNVRFDKRFIKVG